jgi:hypothetical protein
MADTLRLTAETAARTPYVACLVVGLGGLFAGVTVHRARLPRRPLRAKGQR